MLKNLFLSFKNNSLHIQRECHLCFFSYLRLLQSTSAMVNQKNTHQNIEGIVYSYPETESTNQNRQKSILPSYKILQKEKFQIACIQARLNHMKFLIEKDIPITPVSQAILLSNLYHFFEMNVKDVPYIKFLQFHQLFPNPSALIIEVQHPHLEQPIEQRILPKSIKYENKNPSLQMVRSSHIS